MGKGCRNGPSLRLGCSHSAAGAMSVSLAPLKLVTERFVRFSYRKKRPDGVGGEKVKRAKAQNRQQRCEICGCFRGAAKFARTYTDTMLIILRRNSLALYSATTHPYRWARDSRNNVVVYFYVFVINKLRRYCRRAKREKKRKCFHFL